jgi:hypothetical protein
MIGWTRTWSIPSWIRSSSTSSSKCTTHRPLASPGSRGGWPGAWVGSVVGGLSAEDARRGGERGLAPAPGSGDSGARDWTGDGGSEEGIWKGRRSAGGQWKRRGDVSPTVTDVISCENFLNCDVSEIRGRTKLFVCRKQGLFRKAGVATDQRASNLLCGARTRDPCLN